VGGLLVHVRGFRVTEDTDAVSVEEGQVFELFEIDELSVDVHATSLSSDFLACICKLRRIVYNTGTTLTRGTLNRLSLILLIFVPIHLIHEEFKSLILKLKVLNHICVLFVGRKIRDALYRYVKKVRDALTWLLSEHYIEASPVLGLLILDYFDMFQLVAVY